MTPEAHPASFRDPAGQVFIEDGELRRFVHRRFAPDYDRLMTSGLYASLVAGGRLVPHAVVPDARIDAHVILRPEPVPILSYPFEWSFSQLRDAALLTLAACRTALDHGMVLRDANATNVQFVGARPVLIDTLSFGCYEPGRPWAAYRQFCEHFLVPLALMSTRDPCLGLLSRGLPDGIPVERGSRMLGPLTWLRPGLLLHVHLHAAAVRRYAATRSAAGTRMLALPALRRLLEHLTYAVEGLRAPKAGGWATYPSEHPYSAAAAASKEQAVRRFVERVGPRRTVDLGANAGTYSRLAAAGGGLVIAADADHAAVDAHYRALRGAGAPGILPLVVDVRDPSPAGGWELAEREPFLRRASGDLVMMLALVHHLVLTHGVPLPKVFALAAGLGAWAIVELVPPDDPQARLLLERRLSPPHSYDAQAFEAAAGERFAIIERVPVTDSGRVLYLLRRREP